VLLKFIFDPSMSTYSRVVRAGQKRKTERAAARQRRQRPAWQAPLAPDAAEQTAQLTRAGS
jgi:hypothetical protein